MYLITFLGIPGASVVRTLCFHCHGRGSIPGGGTKIPKAMWPSQNKKTNNISLMCSDLPMLLQERKSILVSFSFSPKLSLWEWSSLFHTRRNRAGVFPRGPQEEKVHPQSGCFRSEVKNPHLSCMSQQNQGKPLSQESFKAFFENLKVVFLHFLKFLKKNFFL